MLPSDPLPDLRRARGPKLTGVSVLLRGAADGAEARAGAVAAAVADRHEVLVADDAPARLGALEDDGRLEWVVLADAAAAGSLGELGRCLAAAADHDLVVGRRVAAVAPRTRRAGRRGDEHPFVLVRRELACRLAGIAGGELPPADLAVLAVLTGVPVALVRVHDRPAARPLEPRPRALAPTPGGAVVELCRTRRRHRPRR